MYNSIVKYIQKEKKKKKQKQKQKQNKDFEEYKG